MNSVNVLEGKRDAVRELARIRYDSTLSLIEPDASKKHEELRFLIDAPPGITLTELGNMEAELEELLGMPVHLLAPSDLPPEERERMATRAKLL
ncbi:hypothetical protein SAMN06265795_10951 [Noviherbaspirillum humi]|uniref:Uncharacterized protein n=1 Tax=Noviherbaspirillum humi TaxID=1688639 RepID=A0A239ID74_9BURK|nr:hypothetical protein [Noviherbaspirillum humi]SNS91372.1 hypothetical protein SAMN06265795_10951 [Noviherbaspirillum humi]